MMTGDFSWVCGVGGSRYLKEAARDLMVLLACLRIEKTGRLSGCRRLGRGFSEEIIAFVGNDKPGCFVEDTSLERG